MASKKDMRRPDLGNWPLCPSLLPSRAQQLTERPTAAIPYQEPIAKDAGPDISSTMSQTLPMAAIFLRNKYIGWYELPHPPTIQPAARARPRQGAIEPGMGPGHAKGFDIREQSALLIQIIIQRAAVVFSIQNWLGESEYNQTAAGTPGYFAVGMALMSLVVTYLPMFLPPPPGSQGLPTGTEAAAPAAA